MEYASSSTRPEWDDTAGHSSDYHPFAPAPLIVGLRSPLGRPLGTMERLFWLIDQVKPIHFAITAHVAGTTTPAQWREALDRVQARHPLLSVRIEQSAGGTVCFRRAPGAPIPLRVVPGNPHARWEENVAEELAETFDWQQAPLLRARLVLGPEGAALILVAHHSIADGLSIVYVIRDILRAMSGETLFPLPFPPSQESILGICPAQGAKEESRGDPVTHANSLPRIHPEPFVRSLRLSSRLTLRLKARARAAGASLHGALCAAIVMAGRMILPDWHGRPIRIFSPLELRSLLGCGESCADFVFRGLTAFPENSTQFWALARISKRDLATQKTHESVAQGLAEWEGLLANQTDPEAVMPSIASFFARDAVISNLGATSFPGDFGNLKLEALWGPAIQPAFEGDLVLGATTVDNALHLTLTSSSPHLRFLEAMRSILASACYP